MSYFYIYLIVCVCIKPRAVCMLGQHWVMFPALHFTLTIGGQRENLWASTLLNLLEAVLKSDSPSINLATCWSLISVIRTNILMKSKDGAERVCCSYSSRTAKVGTSDEKLQSHVLKNTKRIALPLLDLFTLRTPSGERSCQPWTGSSHPLTVKRIAKTCLQANLNEILPH